MASRDYPEITFHCPQPPVIERGQRTAWCAACRKRVHNLSAISAVEQQELLAREPAACVSYRLPIAAALLLSVSAAQLPGTALAATYAAVDQDEDVLEHIVITGGSGVPALETVFLETAEPEAEQDQVAAAERAE